MSFSTFSACNRPKSPSAPHAHSSRPSAGAQTPPLPAVPSRGPRCRPGRSFRPGPAGHAGPSVPRRGPAGHCAATRPAAAGAAPHTPKLCVSPVNLVMWSEAVPASRLSRPRPSHRREVWPRGHRPLGPRGPRVRAPPTSRAQAEPPLAQGVPRRVWAALARRPAVGCTEAPSRLAQRSVLLLALQLHLGSCRGSLSL